MLRRRPLAQALARSACCTIWCRRTRVSACAKCDQANWACRPTCPCGTSAARGDATGCWSRAADSAGCRRSSSGTGAAQPRETQIDNASIAFYYMPWMTIDGLLDGMDLYNSASCGYAGDPRRAGGRRPRIDPWRLGALRRLGPLHGPGTRPWVAGSPPLSPSRRSCPASSSAPPARPARGRSAARQAQPSLAFYAGRASARQAAPRALALLRLRSSWLSRLFRVGLQFVRLGAWLSW